MRNSLVLLCPLLVCLIFTGVHAKEPPVVGIQHPALSPDGGSLALVQGNRIHAIDLQTGDSRFLAEKGDLQEHPTWSPDGTAIAFSALEDGRFHLYVTSLSEGWIREAPWDDRAGRGRPPNPYGRARTSSS